MTTSGWPRDAKQLHSNRCYAYLEAFIFIKPLGHIEHSHESFHRCGNERAWAAWMEPHLVTVCLVR